MVNFSRIEWPQRLLQVLYDHLVHVEHPLAPCMPPPLEQRWNIFSFFQQYAYPIKSELLKSGKFTDGQLVDCCIYFLLELIDVSCGDSFLSSKERRPLTALATQKEREIRTLTGNGDAQKPKKRRFEAQTESVRTPCLYKFSRILPLEYFLRIVASLPSVLEHYDSLGGSAVPAYSKEPLWIFINHTLQILDKDPDFFTPLHTYVNIK